MKKNACVIIFLGLLILNVTAFAYPDSGFLPDAISETEYRIVIDLDPKDTKTRNKLGIVLYRKGKLTEARKQFEEVIRLKPDDFNAHVGIGSIRMREGRYKKAIRSFEKAKEINGNRPEVYYHLGRTYRMMGMNATAIEMYRKSLSLKKDPDILRELGEFSNR